MKKYNQPIIKIIELQPKENVAAISPLDVATSYKSGNVATTVYNLALLNVVSVSS